MKTNFVRVVGKAVAFAEGAVLVLHPEQAVRRATWLSAEKGSKNAYRLLARLIFKAGEVVGIVGDAEVEKAAALHVEGASKADFDAYGQRLAESRAASHVARAEPAAPTPVEPGEPSPGEGGQDAPAGTSAPTNAPVPPAGDGTASGDPTAT